MNGELGDAGLTHLVVADTVDPSEIPVTSSRVLVVKQQWFWESIQIEACADEALYQAKASSPHHLQLICHSLSFLPLLCVAGICSQPSLQTKSIVQLISPHQY